MKIVWMSISAALYGAAFLLAIGAGGNIAGGLPFPWWAVACSAVCLVCAKLAWVNANQRHDG